VPVKESSLNVEWENFECSTERKKSIHARYVYGFIFLLTNLMAWLIRDYGQKFFAKINYLKACGVGGLECSRTIGVLRVSLGEVARIGAGIFLLLQLVSVIQFITWWNNYWMPDSKLKQTSVFGLFISTIFYIASILGIVLMYMLFARRLSCILNLFFITWTAILFIVMTVVSLHSKVNTGLLSTGIMASYIIFLCWSAIRSEPSGEKCSPASEVAGKGDWTNVIGFLVAICAIVMATFSTGVDSQSFEFLKDKVQWEDDIPYKWSIDVGWASTWVKIVNEWFAASIYLVRYPLLASRIPPPKGGVAIPNANGAIPTVNANGVPLGTGLAGTTFAGNSNAQTVNGRRTGTQLGPDGLGLGFGTITVIDDMLTSGPDLGSQSIGKAQGVYVASSADGTTQMMAFSAMIEGGEYGDSLNFYGVYKIGSTIAGLSVTSGTGKFKNASGFAEVRPLCCSRSACH
ncbi:hypothetical protein IFM89_028091, partial [Coptis chinensis]